MFTIDGSQGEGGGQIVRTSIALSALTGTPVRVEHVRAGRSKPGLMRQHLTAVRAAAEVCGGELVGDAIGSDAVELRPGAVQPGEYTFRIGTAGSTTLVLQTVLPALMLAEGSSTVRLEGGTHNPYAPPFDFLQSAYLPLLGRMGPRVEARLERAGFYPAGGGRLVVQIEPARQLVPLDLIERGEVLDRRATAVLAQLPDDIGERELRTVRKKLGWTEDQCHIDRVIDSHGPGNTLSLTVRCEHVTEVFTGFGERNRGARAVANDATQQCQRYLRSGAAVGPYLADQLLLPIAIAGGGRYRAQGITRHTRTHIDLVQRLLSVSVNVIDGGRDGSVIEVG